MITKNKRIKSSLLTGFLVISYLLFVMSTGKATEESATVEHRKITLNLPEILSEYEVILKESSGRRIGHGVISSTGQAVLNLPEDEKDFIITLNSTDIIPLSEDVWSRLPLFELGFSAFVILFIFTIGAYYIGYYKAKRVLNILRDYLYDEDLD